ncbi:concanavalin A-like lectin/glucanase superfamily protein [Variovorax sp. 54]|uniref:LamG domain-containing protein n=1 Tax=Variovorax sp. 54 TaxID=2035212 RepID=UPI000C4AD0D3|nr:LamG domain-containing protein [Variovorax sp. 54]PIF76839.1 concanavalin A-like lectin/glucanase superfamily protein [Variovorax sp. 54]
MREAIAQKKVPAALQSLQLAPAWTGGTDGALSEQPVTDGPGWATLLTGTWVPRHAVRADTVDQRIDAKLAPSVFAFAKQKKDAGYLTASVTANTLYPNLLLAETGTLDTAVDCAGADACVTANTTRLIGAGYDLLVAQYSAPAAAASNGLRSDSYQRAVSDTAAAVGQLLARIAQRTANDAKEDWLVILTTGHGLDAFGGVTSLKDIDNKTVFIASNKTLPALPAVGAASPADDNALRQSAAATDIAPTVLRHLGALPATAAYNFNGQALQATTAVQQLAARTSADRSSIELSWTLAGDLGGPVQVLRDGKPIATLPAGATRYTDPVKAAADGLYAFQYTVAAGGASVSLAAQIAYVKVGLINLFPLDALPALDVNATATLAPITADADGGSLVADDNFQPPYRAQALRVDSRIKNAVGKAGYLLQQSRDVTTAPKVTAFTLGFWLRTDATCSQGVNNGGSVIANKNYDTGNNAGLAIGLFGNCELRFNTGTGSGRGEIRGRHFLSAGRWAYIAMVIDKAGKNMNGYVFDPVKGTQTGSVALSNALVAALGGLGKGIALNEDATGLYYQRASADSPRGAMDFNDFAIWNRALTAEELAAIYTSGQPLSALAP